MYLNFTNALPEFKGLPLCIKKDAIVSVRQGFAKRDGKDTSEIITYIFCPPHGTWEVFEPYDKVLEMLNSSSIKTKKKQV